MIVKQSIKTIHVCIAFCKYYYKQHVGINGSVATRNFGLCNIKWGQHILSRVELVHIYIYIYNTMYRGRLCWNVMYSNSWLFQIKLVNANCVHGSCLYLEMLTECKEVLWKYLRCHFLLSLPRKINSWAHSNKIGLPVQTSFTLYTFYYHNN